MAIGSWLFAKDSRPGSKEMMFQSEDHLSIYLTKCPVCRRENRIPKIMEGVCASCNYKVGRQDFEPLSQTGTPVKTEWSGEAHGFCLNEGVENPGSAPTFMLPNC